MGIDTEKIDKQNPIRAYFERRIGRIVCIGIPTAVGFLAYWIWGVESKIAKMEMSNKENVAQWKVLYENREKIQELQVEVEVYKRLFGMMVDPGDRHEEIIENLRDKDVVIPAKKPLKLPEKPELSHERKLDDFRQEHIRNMQRQMQAPTWKK